MGPPGYEAVELLAAFVIVVGGGAFVAMATWQRAARDGSAAVAVRVGSGSGAGPGREISPGRGASAQPSVARSVAIILAGLSAGAGFIHLAVAPSHFDEIGDLAAGFVVAAIFQAGWIRWCLAGPSRRTAWVGIAGNLGIVGAWAWTRTIGLPIGELAGIPEPIGFPDGASVAFELILVAGLAAGLTGVGAPLARLVDLRAAASVAVVPVLGLVLVLTTLATVAIAGGVEHGPAASPHPMAEPAAAGHSMAGHAATP